MMDEEDWVPPSNRLHDVAGAMDAGEPPAKWALYSSTAQGILGVVILNAFSKIWDLQIGQDTAMNLANIIVSMAGTVLLGLWALRGRLKAAVKLYWFPRTKQQKIAKLVGLELATLQSRV